MRDWIVRAIIATMVVITSLLLLGAGCAIIALLLRAVDGPGGWAILLILLLFASYIAKWSEKD